MREKEKSDCYLSNVVSVVHSADIFFIQNFHESCHSPCTLGGTYSEAVHIFLKHYNSQKPQNKQFNLQSNCGSDLDEEPLVDVSAGLAAELLAQVLGVHVVQQLRHVGHVEDVEVEEVVVHQLAQHRLACRTLIINLNDELKMSDE